MSTPPNNINASQAQQFHSALIFGHPSSNKCKNEFRRESGSGMKEEQEIPLFSLSTLLSLSLSFFLFLFLSTSLSPPLVCPSFSLAPLSRSPLSLAHPSLSLTLLSLSLIHPSLVHLSLSLVTSLSSLLSRSPLSALRSPLFALCFPLSTAHSPLWSPLFSLPSSLSSLLSPLFSLPSSVSPLLSPLFSLLFGLCSHLPKETHYICFQFVLCCSEPGKKMVYSRAFVLSSERVSVAWERESVWVWACECEGVSMWRVSVWRVSVWLCMSVWVE
jgi:hypothetical protein